MHLLQNRNWDRIFLFGYATEKKLPLETDIFEFVRLSEYSKG